jgi:hypothetical protein
MSDDLSLILFLSTPFGQVCPLGYGHVVTPGLDPEQVEGRIGMMDLSLLGVLRWSGIYARLPGRQENRPIDWETRVVIIK